MRRLTRDLHSNEITNVNVISAGQRFTDYTLVASFGKPSSAACNMPPGIRARYAGVERPTLDKVNAMINPSADESCV